MSGDTGKKIQVTKQFFIRDGLFLILTAIYVLIIVCFIGGYNLQLAVGHFAIYLIYVVLCVI